MRPFEWLCGFASFCCRGLMGDGVRASWVHGPPGCCDFYVAFAAIPRSPYLASPACFLFPSSSVSVSRSKGERSRDLSSPRGPTTSAVAAAASAPQEALNLDGGLRRQDQQRHEATARAGHTNRPESVKLPSGLPLMGDDDFSSVSTMMSTPRAALSERSRKYGR